MAELPNARIDQLDPGTPQPGDLLVFRDQVSGVTRKVLVDLFLPVTNTADFEWLIDNSYDEDEVVTYGGNWYQSLENANLGNVPGVDGTKWQLLTKVPSGLVYWTAGLYTASTTFVVKQFGGQDYVFRLTGAVPYVSSDFDVELAAGDWLQLGTLETFVVDSTANVTLNCRYLREIAFRGDTIIDSNITVTITNYARAKTVRFRFEVDGARALTFGANVTMPDYMWDYSTKTWTADRAGKYEMELTYEAATDEFYVTRISGPMV